MKNGGIFLPPSQKKIEAVVLMCTMPVCALFHFCIHNIINIIHTYGWFFTLYTSHDIFLYKFVIVIQLCSLVWITFIDGESKFISCINHCICRIINCSLIILDDSWHLAEIWCPYPSENCLHTDKVSTECVCIIPVTLWCFSPSFPCCCLIEVATPPTRF